MSTDTKQVVDLDIRGEIAYITINRPEALNALNDEVFSQLNKQLDKAEADEEVKAIAIMGAGRAFIAGADIKSFIERITDNNFEAIRKFSETGQTLLLRLENSEKLTVAVVDGLSLGGGSELALACKTIVATEAGSFGFPETGIGIYPGLGGMIRTARIIGKPLAKYYALTGKKISVADALELGIVYKLITPDEIEQTILSLIEEGIPDKYRPREIPTRFNEMAVICNDENAENLIKGSQVYGVSEDFASKTALIIAKKAPIALRVVNKLMDAQENIAIREAIQLEIDESDYIFGTEDTLTGLKSVGGDPPVWTNR